MKKFTKKIKNFKSFLTWWLAAIIASLPLIIASPTKVNNPTLGCLLAERLEQNPTYYHTFYHGIRKHGKGFVPFWDTKRNRYSFYRDGKVCKW